MKSGGELESLLECKGLNELLVFSFYLDREIVLLASEYAVQSFRKIKYRFSQFLFSELNCIFIIFL